MPRLVQSEFRSNGLRYRQIKRRGIVTLYSVSSKAGKLYGYEVAILKVARAKPALEIKGRHVAESPEREVYPRNEDFGVYGWYHQTREDAERRFNEALKASPHPLRLKN